MSCVTNMVVLASCGALRSAPFERVQEQLRQRYGGQAFSLVSEEVGGHKRLEADVAVAAFNWVDHAQVCDWLKTAEWAKRDAITVAICDDDDWGWRTVIVKREDEPVRPPFCPEVTPCDPPTPTTPR